MFKSRLSVTQNPRTQASHLLFSLRLDFSLLFTGSGCPVSSPATPRFPLCMAAEESSHTLGRNRKSDSAQSLSCHALSIVWFSRTTVHLNSLASLYLFPALQLVKFIYLKLFSILYNLSIYTAAALGFPQPNLPGKMDFPSDLIGCLFLFPFHLV